MTLKDFFELFELDKVVGWLREILKFYIKPHKFFSAFFSKPLNEKIKQLIFYFLLNLAVFWLLSIVSDLKTLIKITLGDVFLSVYMFIPITLPYVIIQWIVKQTVYIERIVWVLFLSRLLFLPLSTVLFSFFIDYESYIIHFLYNALTAYLFVFILIGSLFFLLKKGRYIIFGALSSILLFNIEIIVIPNLSFDNYTDDSSNQYINDPICKERMEVFNQLWTTSLMKLPMIRCIDYSDSTKRQFFVFDNIYLKKNTTELTTFSYAIKYTGIINHNIGLLDSIVPQLSFGHNRQFFGKLKDFFLLEKKVVSNSDGKYTGKLIDRQLFKLNARVKNIKEYETSDTIPRTLRSINRIEDSYTQAVMKSNAPLYIIYFLGYPYVFYESRAKH